MASQSAVLLMVLLEGLHHISLGTADLQKATEFYREILEFEVQEEADTHVILHLDPVSIRLNFIEGYQASANSPAEASVAFILDVDDFTNAISDLEEAGIDIVEGPLAIENGESLLIQDPDGHFLELFYQE